MPKFVRAQVALSLGLLVVSCLPAAAQSSVLPTVLAPVAANAVPSNLVVEDGTPVKLRTGRTISSADAHIGEFVDLQVIQDVIVGGIAVIPRGSIASGAVVEVHRKRRMGRGGKLTIKLDSVWLINGDKARLRSLKQVGGTSHTTTLAACMGVTALVFYPAAPALLFVRGQDSTLLKGTEVTAYVDGNVTLDLPRLSQGVSSLPAASVPVSAFSPQPVGSQASLSELIALLPRRVLDSQGNEGDAVNLVFIGSQDKIEEVFGGAGWVETIRSKKQAVWHALRKPKNNVAMPMSNLFLFGRPQDYGYAMQDSVSELTRRHHLRIWKTDFEFGGHPVWVGAATHDIGVERDKRKWAITHKIDPDVDGERDFIAGSLVAAHLIESIGYVSASDPILEGVTASGGRYHSDGRVLLLALRSDPTNRSDDEQGCQDAVKAALGPMRGFPNEAQCQTSLTTTSAKLSQTP